MKITTIGEILVDLTQEQLDASGIRHFAAYPGGAPANVAVAASRLGCEAGFIGCVGDDSFGEMLRSTLLQEKVDCSALMCSEHSNTTLAVVTVDGTGERTFSFYRKPGADTQMDVMKTLGAVKSLEGILHFGSVSLSVEPSRSVVLAAVAQARKQGMIITYDPNFRAPLWTHEETPELVIREPLPMVDILKISDEETRLLSGEADPEGAAQKLCAQGVRLVLVTLGARGVLWCHNGRCGHVEGFKVKVADTNGAGDTFFGAFLSRVAERGGLDAMEDAELQDMLRFANAAAAVTTSRHGAIPAMPTTEEVRRMLNR